MAIRFIIFRTFFWFYDFVYIISSIIYSIPSLKNQSVSNYRYYHIPFLNFECKRLYLRHSWAFNSVNGEKGLIYLVGFKTYFHINIFTKNVWFRLRKIKHLGEGWVFWHSVNFVKKKKRKKMWKKSSKPLVRTQYFSETFSYNGLLPVCIRCILFYVLFICFLCLCLLHIF